MSLCLGIPQISAHSEAMDKMKDLCVASFQSNSIIFGGLFGEDQNNAACSQSVNTAIPIAYESMNIACESMNSNGKARTSFIIDFMI
jgi:hypothetical protein